MQPVKWSCKHHSEHDATKITAITAYPEPMKITISNNVGSAQKQQQ